VIRPPADCVVIGQLEHRSTVLQTAASEGLRSAWMALEGEDPELIGTLRAYPRSGAARSAVAETRAEGSPASDRRDRVRAAS
jgi:hypothetical protein